MTGVQTCALPILKVGDKVKMNNSRNVGVVKELRGKKAVLQVGVIPIIVDVKDLVVVVDKSIGG